MTKFTIPNLIDYKQNRKKIVGTTSYDYITAKLADESGVDFILVGDSLANVVQGNTFSTSVTLEEIIYHSKCVSKGVVNSLLVSDLPFMSYQVNDDQAVQSAGRLIKEGNANAVKLEGGVAYTTTISKIVRAGIPVIGHIGLMPQYVNLIGGYKVQGRVRGSFQSEEELIADALALEVAGASAVVIECVPSDLSYKISNILTIPTIGIGAGENCDGQILVINDLIGLTVDTNKPKFVKQFGNVAEIIRKSINSYVESVRDGSFPSANESYK
jgi:3-methyl-2-oxobutanoate hydroxymethyltransferase